MFLYQIFEFWTITLIEGEKMKCEVILPRDEMRGEIIVKRPFKNLNFVQMAAILVGFQMARTKALA